MCSKFQGKTRASTLPSALSQIRTFSVQRFLGATVGTGSRHDGEQSSSSASSAAVIYTCSRPGMHDPAGRTRQASQPASLLSWAGILQPRCNDPTMPRCDDATMRRCATTRDSAPMAPLTCGANNAYCSWLSVQINRHCHTATLPLGLGYTV